MCHARAHTRIYTTHTEIHIGTLQYTVHSTHCTYEYIVYLYIYTHTPRVVIINDQRAPTNERVRRRERQSRETNTMTRRFRDGCDVFTRAGGGTVKCVRKSPSMSRVSDVRPAGFRRIYYTTRTITNFARKCSRSALAVSGTQQLQCSWLYTLNMHISHSAGESDKRARCT